MLKLRVAAMVKRGEQGRARLSRLTVRVQQAGLAAVAIASLGLAGAAALAGTTAHSGTAGATRGMPAQARAAADRIPATRPGTATAYVVNAGSGTVTPIAIANNRAGPAIPVGDNPQAIAITPDGKTAYVANYVSGTVTPITTATNKPGPAIPVGNVPGAIAITPHGKTAYVANWDAGTVTPISTATNKPGHAIRTAEPRTRSRLRPTAGPPTWRISFPVR